MRALSRPRGEPLSRLHLEPDVYPEADCRGCGRSTAVAVVAVLAYGVEVLGDEDDSDGIDVALCAPCLRALADLTEENARSMTEEEKTVSDAGGGGRR